VGQKQEVGEVKQSWLSCSVVDHYLRFVSAGLGEPLLLGRSGGGGAVWFLL
jgi:hypothetical protein